MAQSSAHTGRQWYQATKTVYCQVANYLQFLTTYYVNVHSIDTVYNNYSISLLGAC